MRCDSFEQKRMIELSRELDREREKSRRQGEQIGEMAEIAKQKERQI
jgi:hypothetical protein